MTVFPAIANAPFTSSCAAGVGVPMPTLPLTINPLLGAVFTPP
jgi:hypothetical protein